MNRIGREMEAAQLEREERLRAMVESEELELYNEMALRIQHAGRGMLGRKKAKKARKQMLATVARARAAVKIQKAIRGALGRHFLKVIYELETRNLLLGASALTIERVYRGHRGREAVRGRKKKLAAQDFERLYRGFRGRQKARAERQRLDELRRRYFAASTLQACWRAKVAREEFRVLRGRSIAAEEIQRTFRGHVGRRRAKRRKDWESADPGPQRLRLGLRFIDESKVAFERQREEIDALHRAQEKAETRVSHIHAELRESEKELGVLERELQEIDQLEKDLSELTHEREVLQLGLTGAAGLTEDEEKNDERPPEHETKAKLRADGQALEVAIHRKRQERERKRQELETEFAGVFQEVTRKKAALEKLEVAIADMEATRVRKDREFGRLQRNLMELLQEQKYELDALREKGIELETATATSAAAATATALRAKQHEARAATMFSQTEELMKFQFMSMSLSYFSSLNMLKQLRDMNADCTTAAVASSADAAAAAAAAATAASIPSLTKLNLGGGAEDLVAAAVKKKDLELATKKRQEKEAEQALAEPFPSEMRLWSVDDVGRWLDTLRLGQYKASFSEASVDGEFLLELREDDIVHVLGVEHKLHVRKLLLARDKLKPLNEADLVKKALVLREKAASSAQENAGVGAVPPTDVVFSQARNARLNRLEESLNLGFPIDKEDDKGNTLLCVAAQNVNHRMCDLLLSRHADINHRNGQGNTPLHFAMAYDTDGALAEYLIQHGADDTIENELGSTCYDGIG